MSLQIKNETVYVIYRNGQPYQSKGRKLVYTTKGAANGVITQDAYDEARHHYKGFDWWELGEERQNELVQRIKSEFELVEYTPKGR
ncbi:hypothetical protein [Paenibacillus lactis]|uniref:hypothetical protein n=1 Tax=Paenibacillus lactis TaxID=228574 RepID=UPI003D718F57